MAAESTLERKCRVLAKEHGCWLVKWSAPGRRGVPDRVLFSGDGRVDFIEFKAPGKEPSRMQVYVIGVLEDYGCRVHTVDNIKDFKALLP